MENGIKKQITIRIDEELIERIKDIVYYNIHWTIGSYIEKLLYSALLQDKLYTDAPKRPVKKLKAGPKINLSKYSPEFHLKHMIDDLLKDDEMTQDQYNYVYNKYIKPNLTPSDLGKTSATDPDSHK